MKKILVLATLAVASFLAACGGGGDAPATVTQVPVAPTAIVSEVPQPVAVTVTPDVVTPVASTAVVPAVSPPTPVTPVTHTIPMAGTTDVTLSNVPINVKTTAVNVGQRGVNLAAFNVTFDKMSEEASIQELPFSNIYGGNVGELFTNLRLVDENGDICPQASCYVWWTGSEVRVVFNYGWKPTNELKTYALQADVSPTAPRGALYAFELVGVHMRQWGKRGDELVNGQVAGKPMEVTTIVALPVITSSQGRQIMGATPGMQYEVLNVTVACQNVGGCLAASMQIYVSNASNIQVVGSGTLTPLIGSEGYLLQTDHFIGEGISVTWSFMATAIHSNIYAQFYDMVFRIDGRDFSPVIGNPTAECIDVSQKGGGTCSFNEKG